MKTWTDWLDEIEAQFPENVSIPFHRLLARMRATEKVVTRSSHRRNDGPTRLLQDDGDSGS